MNPRPCLAENCAVSLTMSRSMAEIGGNRALNSNGDGSGGAGLPDLAVEVFFALSADPDLLPSRRAPVPVSARPARASDSRYS